MSNKEAIEQLTILCGAHTNQNNLLTALRMGIEALRREDLVKEIVKETDYFQEVSINALGEDYGYRESMFEIAYVYGLDPWATIEEARHEVDGR